MTIRSYALTSRPEENDKGKRLIVTPHRRDNGRHPGHVLVNIISVDHDLKDAQTRGLLTRDQVAEIHEQLGEWLEQNPPGPRFYVEKVPTPSSCPWLVRDREAPNGSLYLCPARFRTEEDARTYATYLNIKEMNL